MSSSANIIWNIKFRSWAGLKEISGAQTPNFDSKLPSKESDMLDDANPTLPQRRPKELPESKMQ
jgi:hypothetical protein